MQRTCLLFDMDNGGVPLILFGHIEFYKVSLAARLIDLSGHCVATLFVAAGDEHGRALFRKQPGRCAPHAAVTAGDQRHLAFEPHDAPS